MGRKFAFHPVGQSGNPVVYWCPSTINSQPPIVGPKKVKLLLYSKKKKKKNLSFKEVAVEDQLVWLMGSAVNQAACWEGTHSAGRCFTWSAASDSVWAAGLLKENQKLLTRPQRSQLNRRRVCAIGREKPTFCDSERCLWTTWKTSIIPGSESVFWGVSVWTGQE